MKRYLDTIYKLRWFITFFIPLVVIVLSLALMKTDFDGSYRIWFEKDSKKLALYDKFRSEFSNDSGVTIVFRDENGIFNKKAVQSIERITENLLMMKHIDRVDSLTNYQFIHSDPNNPNNIEVNDFIQDTQQATPTYFDNRKKLALDDSTIVDALISKDATTTMIFGRLGVDENEGNDISGEIVRDLHAIIDAESNRTGYKYWLGGGPVITHAFVEIASKDALTFSPLVFIISMILLLLLFRKTSGALIPLAVVLFTFLSVLSIQVLLGYKLNNFTANIPVFIIAIGIADAVHIYSVWIINKQKNVENRQAVQNALQENFLPILLTSLTTAAGFLTLAISEIVPVSTLGIAIASGAILAFFISITWMPAVLFLLDAPLKVRPKTKTNKKSLRYGEFIVKNDKRIILISSIIVFSIGLGMIHTKVDSNTMNYFNKEVEIRKAAEFTMKHLTGTMSYSIIVDSGKDDGIKEPEFLKTVDKFYTDFSKKFPIDMRHMISILDIVKRYNLVLNAKNTIPEKRELIAQYLLLHALSLPQGMDITDKMDFQQRKILITAFINIVDTSKNIEMIHFAEEWWKKTPYTASVTGQTALYASMQKSITNTLIISLLLTILIISFMILVIFKKLKILWILLLPNILPIVLVLGTIGWLNITIDMGVAITGAIVIGIAVDDTIHFLVKYFNLKKEGLAMSNTLNEVLLFAGKPILFTTIVLSLSFSVLIFSNFEPNQKFGMVTSIALIVALLADLLLLPALLSRLDQEERKDLKK